MKTWTTVIALIAAGTFAAAPAFAQGTSTSGESKDKAQSSGSPAAGGSSSTDSSAAKPDTGMKSGKMKSGKGGMAHGGNMEQVRAVQQALKDKGHDPGEIDGKMGPKTQAALRDYQSKEGLKATGRLDSETMAKLGVEAKSSAAESTSSSPSASPSAAGSSASGSAGEKKK